jgi:hypothetical protein
VTQARLAVEVARCFIEALLKSGTARAALNAASRVGKIATETAGVFVFAEYGLDVLAGVPAERFRATQFKQVQWPQTVAKVTALRNRKVAAKTKRQR